MLKNPLRAAALLCVAFTCLLAGAVEKPAPGKVLVASDFHLNPFYDPTLVRKLLTAEPAEWEGILDQSRPLAFSPYGQDTNWWLLQAALDQMRRVQPHPSVIMIDGDLLAHDFQDKFQCATHDQNPDDYRSFVRKAVQFIALQLRKRWPDTAILLTPGNNDDDCGDYAIEANGTFLNDTAETLRELAKGTPELAADWKALGSYTAQPSTLNGVKIISLNTVFFSAKYKAQSFQRGCAAVSSNGASAAFAWLQQKLADAQQAHQRVWLMFHIPPGIDGYASTHPQGGLTPASCAGSVVPLWGKRDEHTDWTSAFNQLLLSFDSTVMASFAGHTHTDDFRVIQGEAGARQFVLINPPISPVYTQNPGFRVVNFLPDGMLSDQTTYYLTDLERPDFKVHGKWRKEYDFKHSWKARSLDAASLDRIYGEIVSTNAARQRWLTYNGVSSKADVNPPDTVRGLYCAIEALGVDEYKRCACESLPAPH